MTTHDAAIAGLIALAVPACLLVALLCVIDWCVRMAYPDHDDIMGAPDG